MGGVSMISDPVRQCVRLIPDPAEQAPLVARSVTPPSPSGRGGTTLLRQRAPRSCTVFVMTPPNEHTSEGGRDDRGVPYHAESTLSSAQVLKCTAWPCLCRPSVDPSRELGEARYRMPRAYWAGSRTWPFRDEEYSAIEEETVCM